MLDIMLDLESMGTTPDSAVVAIGAVEFDTYSYSLGERFYCTIDLADAVRRGLRMDPGTVKWWLKQEEKQRLEVARAQMSLETGLLMFSDFVARCGPTNEVRMWGNDPAFDCGMLGHAYAACGMQQPWKFWNNRCVRTRRADYPSIEADAREGAHHALADAIYQAEHLIKIRRVLDERRKAA